MNELKHMNIGADEKRGGPSFNHFTINTGHNLVQTKKYFSDNPVTNAKLRELAQKSLGPEGVEVIENVRLWTTVEDDAYFGSLVTLVDGKEVPILITFGAKTEDTGKRIWMEIQNALSNSDVAQMMNHRPRAPFVADFLFGYIPNIQSFTFLMSGMSGSFCKCMGWAFLFPEAMAS